LSPSDLPGKREDPSTWPALKDLFTKTFKSKPRADWEKIFDGTDACCTPVFTQVELEQDGFDQRPVVTLRDTPGLSIADGSAEEKDIAVRAAKGQGSGVKGQGWEEDGLSPGVGGENVLSQWVGWKRGRQFDVVQGGLVMKEGSKL
jgi:alpha-methylacyl-CoA racemase